MASVIHSIPIRSSRFLIRSCILRCQKCSKSDDRYSDPSHPEFSNSYSPPGSEVDVDAIRNVSRLPQHLDNRRSRKPPENIDDFTMKFKRKLYMYYGTESGLEPGIMWPTASELQDRIDYQRNWEPTLEEMVEEVNERKERRNEGRMKRQAKIEHNMKMMPQWLSEYNAKLAKKEQEKQVHAVKRERLLEEAQEFIGYKVSLHDERFKALMEEKAVQDLKDTRIRKKQQKEQKMMQRLQALAEEG